LASWGHGRIVERDGHSIFQVDGKPFFLYGAAFFYERLPRDEWPASMDALAGMGINTLDLYVPWNWHELSDGDFDFTGRTSPRRDFDEVLRLAKLHDFKIILRPGPVVRNEWRNGGYPAWLLSRPEYGMPLHDLLEGRYPPTATLQNQHSDDAAAEWMRNATHVTYAKRWLERVLHEVSPYADRILAVALDDDQGAYIDNQTYPAPHFQAYLGWLRDVVRGVTGPNELTFINTYQMKVPASSPVWAMGNWYQSDAYAIGVHDESQLSFSFAELATRPHQPLFASEFQAGWLQGAGEAEPRAADPANTELAIATMLGTGVRGIVNFPAQDTLNPTGWEAPFANFAYAWDAALELDLKPGARYAPTAAFGAFVKTFGSVLAASFPRYDASIVYPGSSVEPAGAGGATFSSIASAVIEAQQACRSAGYACNVVDVGSLSHALDRERIVLFVPNFDQDTRKAIGANFATRLRAFSRDPKQRIARVDSSDDVRRALRGKRPVVENGYEAVFSESRSSAVAGFLSVTNYTQTDRAYTAVAVTTSTGRRIVLPPFVVRAHSAIVSPIDARLADVARLDRERDAAPYFGATDELTFADCEAIGLQLSGETKIPVLYVRTDRLLRSCTLHFRLHDKPRTVEVNRRGNVAGISLASLEQVATESHGYYPLENEPQLRPGYGGFNLISADASGEAASTSPTGDVALSDVYREGSDSVVFNNALAKLIVSPSAGARAFYAVAKPQNVNWFTTVGGLRDDVAIEPPLSTTDRIAKYTHDFPAGTFNRPYVVSTVGPRAATFAYEYLDALPHGAAVTKTVTLETSQTGFDLDERFVFHDLPTDASQRGVSVSSFALDPTTRESASLFAPEPMPIVPNTTRSVERGNAFAIKRGTACIVVAWHAGDVEAASLQERTDSIIARLTVSLDGTAHVIFRELPCGDGDSPLAAVEAEAQHATPQVTPSPARTP
jgi:hypothetical protein